MTATLETTLLAATDLRLAYGRRGRGASAGKDRGTVALAGVSIEVRAGEMVAILGKSGAGKSTLARVLCGLERPHSGRVEVRGRAIDYARQADLVALRRVCQLVFQDPTVSLDPRQRVGAVVAEPMVVRGYTSAERVRRVASLLEAVWLPSGTDFLRRLPRQLSGGERQRVAIARALACDPQVLLLDEPVSSLDLPVRWQVIEVLLELRRNNELGIVVITHDPTLAARICDRVVVIADGCIVEELAATALFSQALDPRTRELIDAVGPTIAEPSDPPRELWSHPDRSSPR